MLSNPTKPVLVKPERTHVDVFVERYERLKGWAEGLTEHDLDLANDLLHDTFIHFTLTKPDLDSIENLDGYLFAVIRNLHLSQLRRASRSPIRTLSVVEYDMMDIPLWASDPRDRLRMRDDLSTVCQFACLRKESSKGGSILILRFFHGYFPEEIAAFVGSTRGAVDVSLRAVRAEAKLYLEDPTRLGFIAAHPSRPVRGHQMALNTDLRIEFRKQIFSSRQGECLTEDALRVFYGSESPGGPDQRSLSHLVSCPVCIEKGNSLLGLPSLARRYPLDTVGKDPGKKGGSGGGSGGSNTMLDSFVNRRDLHFYHEPQELCISVNGQLQGLQRIVSGKGELMLVLDTNENLGFIEVFSEQGLRLLMMSVEPPPVGHGKQSVLVELSYGRTIAANLNFSGAFPALHVTYDDPSVGAAAETTPENIENLLTQDQPSDKPSHFRLGIYKTRFNSLLAGWRSWLRPGRLTASFAIIVIVALVLLKFVPFGRVSAAELLKRSADAEDARLANPDRVLHRTLDLEERNSTGETVSRKRIDIWQSAERGVTARRLYNEQGQLVMGDWRRADGVQTIYKPGEPPVLKPEPERRLESIGFDDVWQLSPSASEFTALLSGADQLKVETRDNNYVINYDREGQTNTVTNSSIVLSKEDLHALAQSLTLQNGTDVREFRFTESSYEWRPTNAVPPVVFEPNVEFGAGPPAAQSVAAPSPVPSASSDNDANSNSQPAAATMATATLEVEVVDLLDSVGAFMGEQVSVQRNTVGQIQIKALVETDKRKEELLNALVPVRNNNAVRINIETVAEAQARSLKGNAQRGKAVSVDTAEVKEETSPVYSDLRKKFSETEARAYADRIIGRSADARQNALAMKQLAERFSTDDLQSLTSVTREKWLSLLRGHAVKFLNSTDALRLDLETVFPDLGGGGSPAGAITSDKEIQSSVRKLYELSVAADEDLRRSLTVFSSSSGSGDVKSPQFWRTLNSSIALARAIQTMR